MEDSIKDKVLGHHYSPISVKTIRKILELYEKFETNPTIIFITKK
jgi:hypothetical protein